MHRTSRLIKLTACLLVGLSAIAANAGATTPRDVLTQSEYQQLNSMFSRLDKVRGSSLHALATKESICRHTDSVSVLVVYEKANCEGFIAQNRAAAGVVSVEKRCDSKPTADAQLNCLIPTYRVFYRSLEAEYRTLQKLERIDRSRGFSRGCVLILGGDSSGVKIYGRIVTDAGQVLSNIRSHNVTRLHAAEDRLFSAENDSTTNTNSRYSLSSCVQAV